MSDETTYPFEKLWNYAEVAATMPKPDGYVFEEIAECLLALGREEEARDYFARAYEQHKDDPWFPPTDPARLQRIPELGAGRQT